MAFLEHLLDDPEPVACGVCDNCAPLPEVAIDPELVRAAVEFLRNRPLVIAPRKRNAENTAIPKDEQILEGRSLAKWSDAGWGTLVRRGKRDDGHFDDELVTAAAKLVADWQPDPAPTWITYVPSLRAPTLVADLAERLGEALGLPVVAAITQVRATEHQVTMQNSAQQSRNVIGAFEVVGALPEEPVLLVDDTVDSRWTLTEVGALLRRAGCPAVHPLALADSGGS